MSKSSVQQSQTIKAPNSAIPAQSSQSRPTSAWSKGPPAIASTSVTPAVATSTATARPQNPTSNGTAPTRPVSHSRKPSSLGPAPSATKESVTMPKNIGQTKTTTQLNFGSISDASATLSSSPANIPPIADINPKAFGSITAEPSSAISSSVKSAANSKPSSTVTPSASSSSAASPTTKPARKKVDIAALFQNPSSGSSSPPPASSPSTSAPPPIRRDNSGASPSLSPAQRQSTLPSPGAQYAGYFPNGNSGLNPGNRQPPSAGPRSPSFPRATPAGPGGPSGQPPNRGPPQPNGVAPPPTNGAAAMSSPRVPPAQLPQQQQPQTPGWPAYQYGYGQMPRDYTPYQAYYDPAYAAHLQQQWYPQQMHSPIPPYQPPPPNHLGHPPAQPPIPPSPRNAHMPPSASSSHTPLPPSVPSTPVVGNRAIPPTPMSPAAPSFTPSASKRSAAIQIKRPDGAPIDVPPPAPKHTPSPALPPAHIRAASVSSKPRLESPDDRAKRLEAEKTAAEAKAAEEAQAKAAEEKVAAEKKAEEDRIAAEKKAEEEKVAAEKKAEEDKIAAEKKAEEERLAAEAKTKEEAELKAAEEERLRVLKEKEKAEAAEAERQRVAAEEAARTAKELEEKEKAKEEDVKAAEEAADEARAADVAAAAAKAEAERAEAERLTVARSAEASAEPSPIPSTASPVPLPTSASPSLPSAAPSPTPFKRPTPGPLNLSLNKPHPLDAPPLSALATARLIDNLDATKYPEGIKSPRPDLNVGAETGKFRYDRDFLLQFMVVCQEKPDNLPALDLIGIERGGAESNRGGGRTRGQSSSGGPSRSASGFGMGGKAPLPGVMGTFATKSSAERFLASTVGRSASVGNGAFGNMGRGGAPPMVRSASHGGPGGIPQSPKEYPTHRTRSGRGNKTRTEKANGGAPSHFNSPSIGNVSLEPVVPLQPTENRWVAGGTKVTSNNAESPEVVERKVKSLLNKLTMEKFDSISTQIIHYANLSEKENNGATLILVIKLIFEKATDEADWSEMYARLCRKMMETISPAVHDESVRNNEGKPIAGGQLFRKYLLNRCQEDFERGWSVKEATHAAAQGKAADDKAAKDAADGVPEGKGETALYSDEYYAAEKAKRRGLGLVKFIGELFKLQMLTERIMHECIKKLLSNVEDPEEEDIESLCRLLNTVGQALDTQKARSHMDIYFARMQELANSNAITSRMQFMLQDVIEFRHRKWVPRNAAAAPTTIAAVHEAAARDAVQDSARLASGSMSRGGSRRGDHRREEFGPDGWSVAGGSAPPKPPTKAGDMSKFGKIDKTASPATFGPTSVFSKKGAKRESAPSLSRASSSANMFSMLGNEAAADLSGPPPVATSSRGPSRKPSIDLGPGGTPEAAPARKRLNLLPRTISTAGEESETVASTPADSGAATPAESSETSMTETQAESRIKEDIQEFWAVGSVDDGRHYVTSIPDKYKAKLIDKLATSSLDKKEADVILVADVFDKVAEEGVDAAVFEEGLLGIVEGVDDLSVDVPKAYAFVARLLKGARLSQSSVETLASKIVVDGDPLTPPRDKLLKEYAKLA